MLIPAAPTAGGEDDVASREGREDGERIGHGRRAAVPGVTTATGQGARRREQIRGDRRHQLLRRLESLGTVFPFTWTVESGELAAP